MSTNGSARRTLKTDLIADQDCQSRGLDQSVSSPQMVQTALLNSLTLHALMILLPLKGAVLMFQKRQTGVSKRVSQTRARTIGHVCAGSIRIK
jgi:hypothetical protein